MTLGWLVAAVLLVLVAAFWHATLAAREVANRAAMETCARAQVQMLDGTVVFQRLGLARRHGGGLSWRRTYVFDYTEDGYSRRRGFVVVDGRVVETVALGPRPV